MTVLSLEQNKPLEKKLEELLGTDDFVVFYTKESEETNSTGLVQGQMSLGSISIYKSILDYMVNAAVYDLYEE